LELFLSNSFPSHNWSAQTLARDANWNEEKAGSSGIIGVRGIVLMLLSLVPTFV